MAEKTGHTKGPWSLDEVRTMSGRAFRIGVGEMLESGKGCCIIYDDYPGNPDNERLAKARLISAAPDLLEALKMLRDADDIALSEGYSGTMGYIQRANVDAAISKAEGK